MNTKTYIVNGYRGWDDYEGQQDNNFYKEIIFDSRFSKKAVEEMLKVTIFNPKKYRNIYFEIIEK